MAQSTAYEASKDDRADNPTTNQGCNYIAGCDLFMCDFRSFTAVPRKDQAARNLKHNIFVFRSAQKQFRQTIFIMMTVVWTVSLHNDTLYAQSLDGFRSVSLSRSIIVGHVSNVWGPWKCGHGLMTIFSKDISKICVFLWTFIYSLYLVFFLLPLAIPVNFLFSFSVPVCSPVLIISLV